MRALGRVSDAQAAALRQLSASSGRLETFFDRLGPFTQAARPATVALGRASRTGRQAVRDSQPTVDELLRLSQRTPELAQNLAITLEHLDDRDNAIEPDERSPGGKGYTGLEAFLQYVFRQTVTTNLFDANNYMLKVNLQGSSECEPYADAERARRAAPVLHGARAEPAGGQSGRPGRHPAAGGRVRRPAMSARSAGPAARAAGRIATAGPPRLPPQRRRAPAPAAPAAPPVPGAPAPVDPGPLLDFLLGP